MFRCNIELLSRMKKAIQASIKKRVDLKNLAMNKMMEKI